MLRTFCTTTSKLELWGGGWSTSSPEEVTALDMSESSSVLFFTFDSILLAAGRERTNGPQTRRVPFSSFLH